MISDLEIMMHGAKRVHLLPLEAAMLTYDKNILGLAWGNNIWIKPGLKDYEERFVAYHEIDHVKANQGKQLHPNCMKDAEKLNELRKKHEYHMDF